jgi:hypothetical protein
MSTRRVKSLVTVRIVGFVEPPFPPPEWWWLWPVPDGVVVVGAVVVGGGVELGVDVVGGVEVEPVEPERPLGGKGDELELEEEPPLVSAVFTTNCALNGFLFLNCSRRLR